MTSLDRWTGTRWLALLLLAGYCVAPEPVRATPPTLYANEAYEGPVRADPDDLLLLSGNGFSADNVVVYAALSDTTQVPAAPASIPATSTASSGTAAVVSTYDVPNSLTIRLPAVMQAGQSYALWVVDSSGQWSNAIRINDARPLWITPAYVYATAAVASLPRQVKVVGRNLQAAPGVVTQVRFSGPASYTLTAADDHDPSTAIEEYAAVVALPQSMPAGSYTVSVSRDSVSWVTLTGQTLTVYADRPAATAFPVGNYGGCAPDDGVDDTVCIVAAIAAAQAAGGGAVIFGAGTWNLVNTAASGVTLDGILVPQGVSLAGAGANSTTLVLDAGWNASPGRPAFALQGNNTVQGITFADARTYSSSDAGRAILQLGKTYYRADPNNPNDPKSVPNVVITQNTFARPFIGIADGGLPISGLFVTYNVFGAFQTGLFPGGNRYNVTYKFRIDDSVVAYNTFAPGSYMDVTSSQGTIASQIGAAHRLDFSHNIADGTTTQYLYSASDPMGWRAAFFWHMNGSHEMMLVSQNTATCTGDKDGDGEAFSYDNNANTFAFSSAQAVLAATTSTVTVQGPLKGTQNGRSVDVTSYYIGHWIQIAQGPGIGQTRRVQSYTIDPSTSQITFIVSPAWEVIPAAGTSRLSVGRQFWQVYTVDNLVDHRQPLCQKSNRTRPKGGVIALWAQVIDSAVEGNRQFDTDGILQQQSYSAEDAACGSCTSWTFFQYFNEVRANTVSGEYNWSSDCSQSGITISHSAAPTPSSPPPVAGYGVSISHNTVTHADGVRGGGIGIPLTWYEGPSPYNWEVVDNTLIHHNTLNDLAGAVPTQSCDVAQTTRIGVNLYQAGLVWGTVLYANACNNVTTPLNDTASETVRLCPSSVSNSCECP